MGEECPPLDGHDPPAEVILDRIAHRTNDYGKTIAEREGPDSGR